MKPREWIDLPWQNPVPLSGRPEDVMVEVTPLQDFATAAGHFPESNTAALPPDIFASYHQPFLYARLLDRKTAEPLAHYRWRNAGKIDP